MDKDQSQDKLRAVLDERMRLGNDLLEAAAARTTAQEAVAAAERQYAAAHKAAIAGGWTATDLRKAGLNAPQGTSPRRPRRRAAPSEDPASEPESTS
ncbi:MAG: hypothetical protein ACTHXC_10980 [Brachybacterium sp.]